MAKVNVGIDLGTYNSAAAWSPLDEPRSDLLQSEAGATPQGITFPSFVLFDAAGEPIAFGQQARMRADMPLQLVWGFKRLLNCSYEAAKPQLGRFLYRVVPDEKGRAAILVGGRQYLPQDIYRLFLEWMRSQILDSAVNPQLAGHEWVSTVISVPAYFDAAQDQLTLEAAREAGLPDPRHCREPSAAAFAYGLETSMGEEEQTVMTIDLGAGTLDISVGAMIRDESGYPTFAELTRAVGDVALGGIDIDDALLEAVLEHQGLVALQDVRRALTSTGYTGLTGNQQALYMELDTLRGEVERRKIELSTRPVTQVFTPDGSEVTLARSREEYDAGDEAIYLDEVLGAKAEPSAAPGAPFLARFRAH
ncbi:MAG: Hsp70 family protein, partial [Armatimonadetes bacterium]|nr:Hsp70 family protein [Armatimonadota bacterium]